MKYETAKRKAVTAIQTLAQAGKQLAEAEAAMRRAQRNPGRVVRQGQRKQKGN